MKLRNEKSISQENEILLKCLAHDIIVLIHEMFKLGIEIDFNFCAESVLARNRFDSCAKPRKFYNCCYTMYSVDTYVR